MNGRLRNEIGLTLIETLAALVVFLIVAGGFAAGTIATIRGNSVSRKASAAAALIQDKIEQFRAVGAVVDSPELSPGTHTDPLNPINALGENGGDFRRSWTVTSSTPNPGLARVEVKVSWDKPQLDSITSVTLVCEHTSCM